MQQVITAQPQMMTQVQQCQPQGIREWSSGLCGCCEDCGSCLYAYCCYICFTCTLANQLDESCFVPLCLGRMGLMSMRVKLRSMAGIRGSICKDFLAMTFCEFCAATQMMREMKHLGM